MHVMNAGILGGVSLDKAFPKGRLFFGEGVNPNVAFPHTTWARIAQGQVLMGVDESDGDYNAARKSGGAKAVSLNVTQLGSHNHDFTGSAVNTTTISHSHNVLAVGAAITYGGGTYPTFWPGGANVVGNVVSTAGAHAHTLSAAGSGTLSNAGGGGAHNNLQPYVVCEIWERTDGVAIPAGYTGSGLPGLDKLFPVGALLYAMADVQPNALYGGTWTRIKGRCVVLVNENDADFAAALKTGGAKAHALSLAQTPAHSHTFTGNSVVSNADGYHAHALRLLDGGYNEKSTGYGHRLSDGQIAGGLSTASHYHTATFTGNIAYTGGSAAHENRQPYLTCYLWYRSA